MNESNQWKKISEIIEDALPAIDDALAQGNHPLSKRHHKAFEIIQETMLTISDYRAFLESDAHGKFLIIIQDWYRNRYGESMDDDEDYTIGMILIHGTPFQIRIPHNFRIRGEGNTQWIGFPASVQSEENPLDWISSGPNLKSISDDEKRQLNELATDISNNLRSIHFDIRSLQSNCSETIAELAASSLSNIEGAAKYLCRRSSADLRHAGWEISQAVEKALKFYIWRKGQTPKFTHDLSRLADTAERLGPLKLDRNQVDLILSGSKATDIRYHGEYPLEIAAAAYQAGLAIIQILAYDSRPEAKYNVREARFQIQTPPWFNFDGQEFRNSLSKSEVKDDGNLNSSLTINPRNE